MKSIFQIGGHIYTVNDKDNTAKADNRFAVKLMDKIRVGDRRKGPRREMTDAERINAMDEETFNLILRSIRTAVSEALQQ